MQPHRSSALDGAAAVTVALRHGVAVPLSWSWSQQPQGRACAAAFARRGTLGRTRGSVTRGGYGVPPALTTFDAWGASQCSRFAACSVIVGNLRVTSPAMSNVCPRRRWRRMSDRGAEGEE